MLCSMIDFFIIITIIAHFINNVKNCFALYKQHADFYDFYQNKAEKPPPLIQFLIKTRKGNATFFRP